MKNKQSILITGCSSGIGLQTAQDLHQAGYQVFASCRKSSDVARLQTMGLQAVQLDVTNTHSIHQAVDRILEITNGRLDAIFNNAGFAIPGAVEDITKQAMQEQFETNVFGLLELTNKIIPIMRQQGSGKIIVNTSILGFIALRYRGAYVASKFALEGLFDSLRLELMHTPIKVSIIQCGSIQSKFRTHAQDNFMHHVKVEPSAHLESYKRMHASYVNKTSPDMFVQGPSAVSKRVLKILKSHNPRARYSVTYPTYLFRFLVRILPRFLLDKILYRITDSETK